jgi:hypothetical protein
MVQFLLQGSTSFCNLREELLVCRQQIIYISRPLIGRIRILQIEIVVSSLDLIEGNTPSLLTFDALFPPLPLRFEFLNADRLALVVALCSGRIGMLVVPDFCGRLAFGKEKKALRRKVEKWPF